MALPIPLLAPVIKMVRPASALIVEKPMYEQVHQLMAKFYNFIHVHSLCV